MNTDHETRCDLLKKKSPEIAKALSSIMSDHLIWRVHDTGHDHSVIFAQDNSPLSFKLLVPALRAGEGKYTCHVVPHLHNQHRWFSLPEIGIKFSLHRSATALAKDISNRFLPTWIAQHEKTTRNNQSWIDSDKQQADACAMLGRLTNISPEKLGDGLSSIIEVNGIRLEVQVTGGSVTLGARHIPAEQAAAVIRSLRSARV